MAPVESLVCWGGDTGFIFTVDTGSNEGNVASSGLYVAGVAARVTTTGTLPGGLAADTTYYLGNLTGSEFTFHTTLVDAEAGTNPVDITSTGTGTHTIWSAYYQTADLSRYGASGSERVYAGIPAWITARNTAGVNITDVEVCHVVDPVEYTASSSSDFIDQDLVCSQQIVTTEIDGVRTDAYHNGELGKGYRINQNAQFQGFVWVVSQPGCAVDGISFYSANGAFTQSALLSMGVANCRLSNCVLEGGDLALNWQSYGGTAYNNIIVDNADDGYRVRSFGSSGSSSYNNLVAKCDVGFIWTDTNTTGAGGTYDNGIAIGNNTNWGAQIGGGASRAVSNCGLSTDSPWNIPATPDTTIDIATTDFEDYNNDDYTPASDDSPQVLAGLAVPDGFTLDVKGNRRPQYVPVEASFSFDNGSGTFEVGERVTWNAGADGGFLLEVTGTTTGIMKLYVFSGDTVPGDNDTITGSDSSATCDVNGTVDEPTDEYIEAVRWSAGPIEHDFGGPLALVSVTVTVLDSDLVPIEGAVVYLFKTTGGDVVLDAETDANGVATITYPYDADTEIEGWARRGSGPIPYDQGKLAGTIELTGYTQTAILSGDG